MARFNGGGRRSPAAEAAAVAVVVALLIALQYALSWVAGVEVVTVLLLCFCWSFGVRAGMLAAVSFSLLRCLLFGFTPQVIVLYLVYYPAFAATFGAVGGAWRRRGGPSPFALTCVNVVLLALSAASGACAALGLVKVSRLAKAMVDALLWTICALCLLLTVALDVLSALGARGAGRARGFCTAAFCASVAAAFTVAFTLLDDVITPLFMGWGLFSAASAGYFYSSFLVLTVQVVCVIVSVCLLFVPLTAVTDRFARG